MLVLALYTLSGAAGLILESVFLRQIGLLVGNTPAATGIVLAAFLGGLALGASAASRVADVATSPLRLYGLLEIGAGASGAVVVALLGPWHDVLLAPLRLAGLGPSGRAVEIALAFTLLGVPASFLGATFPALARLRAHDPRRIAGPVGLLYGLNTLGGAAGALAAGFWLFESVGVARSGFAAALADLAIGFVAVALSRAHLAETRGSHDAASGSLPSHATRRACLAAAALGGAAMLGCEVVWTRLLTLPMRSFVYSFSLMLSLFLVGLVLGALLLAALAPRIRDPLTLLGACLVAAGVYSAASVAWLPLVLAPPEGGSFGSLLARATLGAALVVLPPTILSGMALPLAVRGVAPDGRRVGHAAGVVYAANTLGSIAGALAAGLFLLPALGAPRALAVLSVVAAAGGSLAVLAARPGRAMRATIVLALAVPVAFVFWPTGRFVEAFLRASRGRERIGRLLYFHEGATDTVAVVTKDYGFHDPGAKSLITNGVAMSATVKPVRRYMAAEGHLPVLFAVPARRALAVGIGTGITLAAIVSHPELETVDAVELSEGVLGALRSFDDENLRADLDPRVHVRRDDGRRFLARTLASYDLVTVEPPPPIVAGSSSLYSLDFYRLARRVLRPGGVMAQWLPLHAQSLPSARMTARTFLAAFPYAQLWLPSVRDAVLIGSDRPLVLDSRRLEDAYATPSSAADLRAAYLETPDALLATYLLDTDGLRRWAGPGPILTDERPLMEYFRTQGPNMTDRDIATLLEIPQADPKQVVQLDSTRERVVLEENAALRLYVRAAIRDSASDRVDAARRARATEFLRYPLGCTTAQLAALGTIAPRDAAIQTSRCRDLGPPPELR